MRCKLSEADFDKAYEMIAVAIDRVGPKKDKLFLSKLCLTLAAQMEDLATLKEAIRIAEKGPA